MRKFVSLILGLIIAAGALVSGQDSTGVKGFNYSRLKPVVHFFTNAEFNPSKGTSKDYSFWIGRALLGFNYQFDTRWSAKLLIDRTRLTGSINTMYVKVAHIRWEPDNRFALEIGTVNQNNYIPFETFYGYRFVAETFQDRYYGTPSSDIGIIGYFKLSKKISFDAAITNGEGPRIDQDDFGKLRFAGGLNFSPVSQIQTRVFYQLKSSGEPGRLAKEHLFNANITYKAGEKARFGIELNYIKDFMSVSGTDSYGGTAFGCITLYKSLNFLVRYDRLIMKRPIEIPGAIPFSQNACITGFSLSPAKGITICLNYQGSYRIMESSQANHRILFSFEYRI
jgi:hypothetical protein